MNILKKYQVFVSSTYVDLKEERQAAWTTLMKADCFPLGMELFLTDDLSLLDLIKKTIDECDFYLLIVGGKYGSVHPQQGISFTEIEYDYAVQKGKYILRFVHKDIDSLKKTKRETDPDKLKLLKKFMDKVKNDRFCCHWGSKSELQSEIASSISHAKSKAPDTAGWIPVSQANYNQVVSDAANTITSAFESIKKELPETDSACDVHPDDFAEDDDEIHLQYNYTTEGFSEILGTNSKRTEASTYKMTFGDMYTTFLPEFRNVIGMADFIRAVETYIKMTLNLNDTAAYKVLDFGVNVYQCSQIVNHFEAAKFIRLNDDNPFNHWELTRTGYRKMLTCSVFQRTKTDDEY